MYLENNASPLETGLQQKDLSKRTPDCNSTGNYLKMLKMSAFWYTMVLLAILSQAAVCNGLKIGAFNIKTFGKTKMAQTNIASIISKIADRYDVLLLQEVRDKSLDSVRQLMNMLTHPFSFVSSEPLGRTTYKEQYVYLYRTDRMLLLKTYQYPDVNDVFEREPFTVLLSPATNTSVYLALIGLHSKPEDATSEIGHLPDVIGAVLENFTTYVQPIVLGDLNADCSYANLNARIAAGDYLTTTPSYIWLINEDTTVLSTTTCAYDRIVVRSEIASHVVNGSAHAFDFGAWLSLTEDVSYQVSDHKPVEAELDL